MTTWRSRSPILVTGALVGLIMGGADLVAGRPLWQAAPSLLIPVAYAGLIALVAGRSETASVLAGAPVDERWQLHNLQASAWALGISAIAALGGVVVTRATDGDPMPYILVCVVMAVSYVGGILIARLRG